MGKLSQQLGKAGEEYARLFLKSIGAKFIEKISTPVRIVNGKAIFYKKSSIDFTAVLPDRMVSRIEVKLCDEDKLDHSRLTDDQVLWLTEWSEAYLFSWVIWVHKSHCYMFRYPHPRFCAGKSLDIETAIRISEFKN